MFGFEHIKWYGIRRTGLMGNHRIGKNYHGVLSGLESKPPTKGDFYKEGLEPHPSDEVVELKLVAKKILS